jgi:hypothetical protein
MLDQKEQKPNQKLFRSEVNSNKNEGYKLDEKMFFPLRINKITSDPRRSPSSLPPSFDWKLRIELLSHFYSRKCEK